MAHSSPLPPVGAPVHSSGGKLSDTESDEEKSGSDMTTPTKRKKPTVLGTPAVPSRYPNLETPTQVQRAISKPRQLRRTASNQEDCLRVLTKTFNKPSYRGRQQEIMEAAMHGADVLVVAPTGMGKSLCFQVPAVADNHGITIVISPLLSLMKNQVEALRGYGVKVHVLSSETTFPERQEIEKDLASGHPYARLLYITPESLFSTKFLKSIKIVVAQKELRRLVVDEAHCISEWGSSFRPEYRKLGFFRKDFPDIPIMALTASATAAVERDIIAQLGLSARHLYRCVEPFNRTNLYYEVRYRPEPDQYRIKDVEMFIKAFAKKAPVDPLNPEKRVAVSGIIYCRARAMCDQVAEMLREEGIGARPFHRGLKNYELDKTLHQWLDGSVECVVATIAFGMGIDKPNVRYVVHFDLPKSFEGYYQETGRAGRDGHISRCLLYYSREDAVRLRRLVNMESGKKTKPPPRVEDDDEPDEHSGVDSFKQVQHYAESTTLCRHIAICRYFGEKIDETNPATAKTYCDNMCDICVNPQKVAAKAKELTEEVAISSQIPFRKGRDREELNPVHPVSFYGRCRSPTPPPVSIDLPKIAHQPKPNRNGDMLPPPRPAVVQPPINQASSSSKYQKSAMATTNPYLAPPPGPSRVGIGHAARGLAVNDPRNTAAAGPAVQATAQKVPRSTVILERSEPPTKKSKIADTNPYAASPSSSSTIYTVAARRVGSQHGFKTPFMSQPRITPTQRANRKLKETSSFDFDIEEDSLQVEMTASQKLPAALRRETLKAIVKAMHNNLTETIWERLFANAAEDTTVKRRTAIILGACKGTELDVLMWSVSAEGYSERTARMLRAIRSPKAWQMVCSGELMGDDEDDNEEADSVEQIRQRILTALQQPQRTK